MHAENTEWYGRLLGFLDQLEAAKLNWKVVSVRSSIRVRTEVRERGKNRQITIKEYLEVEFFPNGHVTVRRVGKTDSPECGCVDRIVAAVRQGR